MAERGGMRCRCVRCVHVCMRDVCGMEARHLGGMRCGFVDLTTFFFVHLVLLGPGWGSTRAGSLGTHGAKRRSALSPL